MKLLCTPVLVAALLLFSAGIASAQGFGRHRGMSPSRLLMIPEVQRELKLEQDQLERLQQLGQEMQGKAQANFRTVEALPREERDKRFATFQAEYRRRVDDILDARQAARLKQLALQQEGVRALGRKEVQDDLRLSAEQRQRVDSAFEGEREAMRQAFDGFRNGSSMTPDQRGEARKKFDEARASTDAKLSAVLTDGQRRHFQSLQGAPFRFPDFRRGGRGGRGGRGPRD